MVFQDLQMSEFQRSVMSPSSGLKNRWRLYIYLKCRCLLTSPHRVTTQKTNINIFSIMRNLQSMKMFFYFFSSLLAMHTVKWGDRRFNWCFTQKIILRVQQRNLRKSAEHQHIPNIYITVNASLLQKESNAANPRHVVLLNYIRNYLEV